MGSVTFRIEDYIDDPVVSEAVRYQARMYVKLMYGTNYGRGYGNSMYVTGADPRYGLSVFQSNERVRHNWYRKNGLLDQYVPKVYAGSVPLRFSLWEQAEARHRGDKAVKRVPKVVTPAPDNFIINEAFHVSTEGWKPQGKLYMTSAKPLRIHDSSKISVVRVIAFDNDK